MRLFAAVLLAGLLPVTASVRAETEQIDLKALAKKARPAVMLLVVSDATGKEIATGTGFLVSSDGKLITNFHVIEKAASAVAKSENGGLFPVEGVLASDPKNDLVLLKLKAKDLPFLTLGKSENIEVGTRIAVIGSPLGLEGTLSEGIVSAVRELSDRMRLLQVSAAISPGSSGSPVLNTKGEVVGAARALLQGGQALNFAVPVEVVTQLLRKVHASIKPQPLQELASSGENAVYSDQDWRAAEAAEISKDYVEELKRSKALVKRYPESALAYNRLARTYLHLNFIDDVITSLREAIKLKPDYSTAWSNLGIAYSKCRRWDDAVNAIRQALKLDPDDPVSWGALGAVYSNAGHTAETVAAFQQAIKLKPDYALAWRSLGGVYGESGRTDDEIAAYRQAIKIKPDDAEAWFDLGYAYSKSGRPDDEIAAYRQAVKIKPDYAEAWNNLGVCYEQSGRSTEAIAAFAEARKLKP